MSDDTTRTRFLGAIAAQLPVHRVIELHLFGAIRQGGMESGVAVIAVDPNEPVPAGADDSAAAETSPPDTHAESVHAEAPESLEEVLDTPVIQADGQVADDAAEAGEGDAGEGGDHAGYDAPVDDAPVGDTPAPRVAAPRYTVYTARYRHTLKGPDRGKWETSVTEEADAPLLTVDAVVRGVSRRSGEVDETLRLSGDEFRAALPDPLPVTPARPPLAGRRG
jgi:hypothetical protein